MLASQRLYNYICVILLFLEPDVHQSPSFAAACQPHAAHHTRIHRTPICVTRGDGAGHQAKHRPPAGLQAADGGRRGHEARGRGRAAAHLPHPRRRDAAAVQAGAQPGRQQSRLPAAGIRLPDTHVEVKYCCAEL